MKWLIVDRLTGAGWCLCEMPDGDSSVNSFL